nr:hypothetical protein [uncultured Flavobacterium sp.]
MKTVKKKKNDDRTIIDTLVVLPNTIVDKINTIFLTEKTKNHVYSFISQLANSSQQNDKTTNGIVPFSTKKFRAYYGNSYHHWLKPLLDSSIVKSNNHYSIEKKKCKEYWINPMYNVLTNIESDCSFYNVEVPIKLSIKKMSIKELRFQTEVTNDFKNLKFDELKLSSIVKKYIDDFSLEDYLIGENIVEEKFQVSYTDCNGHIYTKFMKRENAIINSKKNGEDLIFDRKNNKYYSYKLEDFIMLKKSAIERYYLESILKLVRKKVYARRNKTNFRVDSNITNCPSLLFEQIMSDNNLCQIDMSNAQFAIFSNNIATKNLMIPHIDDVPMKKRAYLKDKENELKSELELLVVSEDFKRFSDFASSGKLYNEIQKKLCLKSRGEAKKIMFQLLFSSERLKNDLKDKLVEMFPNVIAYIDNYKKCYGYKNFSIGLQKRESEIFIDEIYLKLKKASIATITRHDSIIVSFEDEVKAYSIINKCFKSINFNCILEREGRISNRFYELSKLKQEQVDLGINEIVQVIRPGKSSLVIEDVGISILEDEKGLKKMRAPKKSTLNFDR